MHREPLILGWLALIATPGLVLAQAFDERSIPEPTELGSAASSAGAETRTVSSKVSIESRDANAEVEAVEIRTADGKRQCGLRMTLSNDDQSELLYLAVKEAEQLRDEFVGFDPSHSDGSRCEAASMCVTGVARCRPSQRVRQAYCPSIYSTPQGERGVYLSGSQASFRFPATPASLFATSIENVLAFCRPPIANDSRIEGITNGS